MSPEEAGDWVEIPSPGVRATCQAMTANNSSDSISECASRNIRAQPEAEAFVNFTALKMDYPA
jgi:hypothetical protein